MLRQIITAAGMALTLIAGPVVAGEKPAVTLYKNPQCSCCEGHAAHLRENGYSVKVVATHDMSLIKKQHGVPEKFEGCHTLLIDKYVVEGHVPAKAIDKLLAENPDIKGISLPGMPNGSPGMGGRKTQPFTIYEIGSDASRSKVFTVE